MDRRENNIKKRKVYLTVTCNIKPSIFIYITFLYSILLLIFYRIINVTCFRWKIYVETFVYVESNFNNIMFTSKRLKCHLSVNELEGRKIIKKKKKKN